MTMLRRTFETPGGFVLVTVHVETGEVIAAVREHTYDEWSRPLPECDRQDDTEPGRPRHAYDSGSMLVVPVVAEPATDAEIGAALDAGLCSCETSLVWSNDPTRCVSCGLPTAD